VFGKQSREKNREEPPGKDWDSLAGSFGHLRTEIFLIRNTGDNLDL